MEFHKDDYEQIGVEEPLKANERDLSEPWFADFIKTLFCIYGAMAVVMSLIAWGFSG